MMSSPRREFLSRCDECLHRNELMSGPIVRTGATPEFWKNYDNIFTKGGKSKKAHDLAAKKSVTKPHIKKGSK